MSGNISNTVTDYNQLVQALEDANAETTPGVYTIDLSGSVIINGLLPGIDLQNGVTLDIVGDNAILDGGGTQAGLYVYQGDVSISDLIIQNATAAGGNDGTDAVGGGGGGGAGLGGGLFVGSHAQVTISNVAFINDGAIGGNGAEPTLYNGFTVDKGGHGRSTLLGQHHLGTGASAGAAGNFGGGGGGGFGGGQGAEGGFGGGNGGHGVPTQTTLYLDPTIQTYRVVNSFTTQGGRHEHTSYLTIVANTITVFKTYPAHYGQGGGGLAAGGDIFVQGGGSLKVLDGGLSNGSVKGGSGANGGEAFGSSIFLQGSQTLTLAPGAGKDLIIFGSIADEAGSGGGSGSGSVVVDGGGTVELSAANSFTGGLTLDSGTLILNAAGAAGSGTVTFGGAALLSFNAADAPAASISGFSAQGEIDITDFDASKLLHKTFLSDGNGGGTLMLLGAQIGTGSELVLDLKFADANGANFTYGADSGGGLTISDALCFLRGTRVLTVNGEIPVEEIQIGDVIPTRFGGDRAVKFVGRQSYSQRFVQKNPFMRPVCIRPGALGDGLPRRPLYLSGGHSVLLENRLVLARSLVNGVTITEVESDAGAWLDYFQIEFDSHDCLIAEGVYAESYADGPGLRAQFHNAAEFHALYPNHVAPDALQLCLPRPERGRALEQALRPVVARAAQGLQRGALEGLLDICTAERVEGWARDRAYPKLPVAVELVLNGKVIATALACDPRDDLRTAGLGNCHFAMVPPRRLTPKQVAALVVRGAESGAPLARPLVAAA